MSISDYLSRRSAPRLTGWVLTAAVGAICLFAVAAGPANATTRVSPAATRVSNGVLTLRLAGLPRGAHGRITLLGPPQSSASKRKLRRHLTIGSVRRLELRAGRYRVKLAKVKLRQGKGRIDAGAVASPVHKTLRVAVRADRESSLDVRYGTIINPGVRGVSNKIVRVLGDPGSPSGLVLAAGAAAARGQILSAEPSAQLPHGLLARVTAVHRVRGGTVVDLTPEDIYDVAPNMTLDVPLSSAAVAKLSKFATCKVGELSPSAQVSNVRLTGGWTTTRVLFSNIKTGAQVELHYRVSVGVGVTARAGIKCSLSLPEFGIQGMAGPIPVYGGFRPSASAELGAAATMEATGSVDVTTGARVGGIPPSAAPIVNFSSPRFELSAQQFAGLKASIGLDAEIGIGVANAANIHASVGNSLDFTAAPGQCSWDLNLGSFKATGEIGPLSISTPSTLPLYHRNLWHSACGAPPPPPPPPAPVLQLPLTRATMSWNTDSDIDLYSWDEAGRETYFGEPFGIPGAELVRDVIPTEGEFSHDSEYFRETASPGRRYTFGVCDFRGEGGDVTLTVNDPSGPLRVFHATLFEESDGVVLTTSPVGGGYAPPPGWCRFAGP